MAEAIELVTELPASPSEIYAAFLDAELHAAMTGAGATSDPSLGGSFTAWDGYIEGRYLELEPGARLVAAWRTSDFEPGSGDSRIELRFEPTARGTRLVLVHSEIPDGQGERYREGWHEYYFEPMRSYFAADAR